MVINMNSDKFRLNILSLTAYCLLLTTCRLLLTAYFLLLTTCCLLLASYFKSTITFKFS